MNCGRAQECGDTISLIPSERTAMWASIEKNVEKYGATFMGARMREAFSEQLKDYFGNCGVGSKDITINPYGEVRPCLLFPSHLSLGNITEESYDEIFKRNTGFISLPNTGGEECKGCPAYSSCAPCVVKGLKAYCRMRSNGFDSCNWGKVHKVSQLFSDIGWDIESFNGSDESVIHSSCGFELSL
jgi:radical SAM protein with 4Fe4S-binding SPASM domain